LGGRGVGGGGREGGAGFQGLARGLRACLPQRPAGGAFGPFASPEPLVNLQPSGSGKSRVSKTQLPGSRGIRKAKAKTPTPLEPPPAAPGKKNSAPAGDRTWISSACSTRRASVVPASMATPCARRWGMRSGSGARTTFGFIGRGRGGGIGGGLGVGKTGWEGGRARRRWGVGTTAGRRRCATPTQRGRPHVAPPPRGAPFAAGQAASGASAS
jgi:hypothetical protein